VSMPVLVYMTIIVSMGMIIFSNFVFFDLFWLDKSFISHSIALTWFDTIHTSISHIVPWRYYRLFHFWGKFTLGHYYRLFASLDSLDSLIIWYLTLEALSFKVSDICFWFGIIFFFLRNTYSARILVIIGSANLKAI
jgi:hypothetical protein